MTDASRTVDFDVLRFVANAGGNTGAGLAFVDPAGRYLFVSEGLAAINGLPAADHVGRTLAEVVPELWPLFSDAFERARSGEATKVELTGPEPSDHDRTATWEAHWSPVMQDGQLLGVVITVVDITELRAAQLRSQALTERQATLRYISNMALDDVDLPTIFEQALNAMELHLDAPFTRLLEVEPGSDRLDLPIGTGWDPEIVATTPTGRRAGSFVDFVLQNDAAVTFTDLSTEQRFRHPELFVRHGIASGIGVPIVAGNRPWGIVACYYDVPREFDDTQVAFIEDLAVILGLMLREREARALQSDVLSLATHEIRTPLTNVIGLAQHIKRRVDHQRFDEVLELVDPLVTEAFRVDAMLSQWTELANAESAPLSADDREPIDIAALLEEEISRFGERHPTVAAALRCSEPIVVSSHRGRIAEILENLMENGVKYAGTDLEVVAERERGSVAIRCRDNGPGIDPEALPHIFERFYRGAGTSGRTGMGLGLYILRRLAESLGGTIEVESEPGKGAMFTLRLPDLG